MGVSGVFWALERAESAKSLAGQGFQAYRIFVFIKMVIKTVVYSVMCNELLSIYRN